MVELSFQLKLLKQELMFLVKQCLLRFVHGLRWFNVLVDVLVTKTKTVKARVLVDCVFGAPNAVVQLSAAEAKAAQADRLVDTDKAAVAYAESLKLSA